MEIGQIGCNFSYELVLPRPHPPPHPTPSIRLNRVICNKRLNLKYLSLTIALFFFYLFAVIFDNFFPYSINYVIKIKYFVRIKSTIAHECYF